MPNHFYAVISRMKNIDRWGLMRNTRSENLSEHSLETAQIAHALALIGNRRLGKQIDPGAVAVAAMYHDTTEILTGDLPTPVKYYNHEIKDAYKQIEKAAQTRLLDLLPDDLHEDFQAIYEPEEPVTRLVKAADKLSALIKCTEELNMGNREFAVAEQATRKAIRDLHCEEADIFLEEFMPGFSLSLDEQTVL